MKVPAAILTLMIFGLPSASGADTPPKLVSPAVAFSKGEQTVSIAYEGGQWTFRRPVVSPWQFKVTGKVYWVDPRGDDANGGTPDKPFRTIGKSVAVVGPCDLIHISPEKGTYLIFGL